MPRTKAKGRAANGTGSIRKKTVKKGDGEYSYWEGRFTVGFDPGTGKQVLRSITGKTQKEVAQKLRQATVELDQGVYQDPCKLTLTEWLNIWRKTYLHDVKPRTKEIYESVIRVHIIPALGAIRLEALSTPTIQEFYNNCITEEDLSAKSLRNIHCVLHRALQQAVAIGYLRFNPTDACTLPRMEKRELTPLDDCDIAAFLQQIKDTPLETLMTVTLFTGMREGEVMGLQWNCVDFVRGTITINKQLQYYRDKTGYQLVSTKNGKGRVIVPAAFVMALLRKHRTAQAKARLLAGAAWEDAGFVFTDELGHHLNTWTVYREFKRAVTAIGRPDARFHDLRHSYAVAAIRSGDDLKTVQGNLGHATAAFTLDVYGHVTDQMKQASAARMEQYIKDILAQ